MRQALDEALVDRFGDQYENNRYRAGRLLQRLDAWAASTKNYVGRKVQELRTELFCHLETRDAKSIVDLQVAADNPAQLLQLLHHCRDPCLNNWIVGVALFKPADAPESVRLLSADGKRPCRGCTDKRNDRAPLHLAVPEP